MKIGIAAGGTGGHITPALRVAKALIALGIPCVWFGRENSLEARIASAECIPFIDINAKPLIKKTSILSPLLITLKSVYDAKKKIQDHNITCVFSTGAYVSLPTAFAAKVARIPLVIHEQNTHMGLCNRLLMYLANRVCLGMPIDKLPSQWLVGNPVGNTKRVKRGSKLLVMGGSQGAAFLNHSVPAVLAQVGFQGKIIHICGTQEQLVKAQYEKFKLKAEVFSFVNDMHDIYSQAGIVIARAGAMSLAELSQYGLPSILVPYPHARGDHQKKNADYYCQKNAAIAINECSHALHAALNKILQCTKTQQLLSANIKSLHQLNVQEKIIRVIEELHA